MNPKKMLTKNDVPSFKDWLLRLGWTEDENKAPFQMLRMRPPKNLVELGDCKPDMLVIYERKNTAYVTLFGQSMEMAQRYFDATGQKPAHVLAGFRESLDGTAGKMDLHWLNDMADDAAISELSRLAIQVTRDAGNSEWSPMMRRQSCRMAAVYLEALHDRLA